MLVSEEHKPGEWDNKLQPLHVPPSLFPSDKHQRLVGYTDWQAGIILEQITQATVKGPSGKPLSLSSLVRLSNIESCSSGTESYSTDIHTLVKTARSDMTRLGKTLSKGSSAQDRVLGLLTYVKGQNGRLYEFSFNLVTGVRGYRARGMLQRSEDVLSVELSQIDHVATLNHFRRFPEQNLTFNSAVLTPSLRWLVI